MLFPLKKKLAHKIVLLIPVLGEKKSYPVGDRTQDSLRVSDCVPLRHSSKLKKKDF